MHGLLTARTLVSALLVAGEADVLLNKFHGDLLVAYRLGGAARLLLPAKFRESGPLRNAFEFRRGDIILFHNVPRFELFVSGSRT